ncbi:hypothetical protein JCM8547_005246, partial [Rhodosporidiobolus lusitaniae]
VKEEVAHLEVKELRELAKVEVESQGGSCYCSSISSSHPGLGREPDVCVEHLELICAGQKGVSELMRKYNTKLHSLVADFRLCRPSDATFNRIMEDSKTLIPIALPLEEDGPLNFFETPFPAARLPFFCEDGSRFRLSLDTFLLPTNLEATYTAAHPACPFVPLPPEDQPFPSLYFKTILANLEEMKAQEEEKKEQRKKDLEAGKLDWHVMLHA